MAVDAGVGYQLECRWTFIDIRECEVTTSAKRSQSEPPPNIHGEESESEDVEEQDQDYATSLSQRVATWTAVSAGGETAPEASAVDEGAGIHLAASENSAEVSDEDIVDARPRGTDEVDEQRSPVYPSEGSIGHPHVCKRPCVYFAKGDCEFEEACGYCHMEHTKNRIVLDKRQREQLRALSEVQLWSLLLPHLRKKAAQWTLSSDPLPVVRLAEVRFVNLQQEEGGNPQVPRRLAQATNRSLQALSFGALLGLAASHLPEQADILNEAVESLRVPV